MSHSTNTCHMVIISREREKIDNCYDLKLELRLHLGKGLRKNKGIVELVKCKDIVMYLCYIYY